MPMTTSAAMATFQAVDPLRLRFGFRYRAALRGARTGPGLRHGESQATR